MELGGVGIILVELRGFEGFRSLKGPQVAGMDHELYEEAQGGRSRGCLGVFQVNPCGFTSLQGCEYPSCCFVSVFLQAGLC